MSRWCRKLLVVLGDGNEPGLVGCGWVWFGLVMVSSERSLAINLFEARHPSCKATNGTYQCFVLLSSGLLLQLQFALPLSLCSSPVLCSPLLAAVAMAMAMVTATGHRPQLVPPLPLPLGHLGLTRGFASYCTGVVDTKEMRGVRSSQQTHLLASHSHH